MGKYDNDDEESGFSKFYVEVFRDGEIRLFKILLPSTPGSIEMINSLKEIALKKQVEFEVEKERIKTPEKLSIESPSTMSRSASSLKKINEISFESEFASLSEKYSTDLIMNEDELLIEIYSFDEPMKLISKTHSPDRDIHSRNFEIFKKLKELGNFRRLSGNKNKDDVLQNLEQLKQVQPHFGSVIELVKKQIALAEVRSMPLEIPPILVFGEPGCGKTYFMQQLALVLDIPIHQHSLDGGTTDSTLTGSAAHWGNTTVGKLFEVFCLGEFANPIFLLDEIDKAAKGNFRNALGPLHSLLEPISASRVTDISVNITFNARYATWIATANDPMQIPASLRSRFIEFFILPPMGINAIRVAQGIASKTLHDMNLTEFDDVSDQIVKTIAHLTAREQTHVLKQAFASAVAENRLFIQKSDLPAFVHEDEPEDSNYGGEKKKPRTYH